MYSQADETRAPQFIDYSQFYSYSVCPWKWYERQVNRRQKAWPRGAQRDDNMAIGSLVHDGLQSWYESGRPEVSEKVLAEIGPTPEAFALVNSLLQGFVRQYPVEGWTLQRCEEPVRAPLLSESFMTLTNTDGEGPSYQVVPTVDMLAKIDSYFLVTEPLACNSGVDGYDLTLTPGYWIQEFKTKAQQIDRGKWIQGWETNMQASFQLLCLKHKLRGEDLPIQGVLVSVLEKPKAYVPKRKCKGCDESFPLSTWIPAPAHTIAVPVKGKPDKIVSTDLAGCPDCGNIQVVKPYEPKKAANPPSYFRFAVTRSVEQLEIAKARIAVAAEAMSRLRSGETNPEMVARTTECSSTWGFGECDYRGVHTYRTSTLDDPRFEVIPDYVHEPALVQIDQ